MRARLTFWLLTGPIGHLYAGVVDVASALTSYWWGRLRGRLRS